MYDVALVGWGDVLLTSLLARFGGEHASSGRKIVARKEGKNAKTRCFPTAAGGSESIQDHLGIVDAIMGGGSNLGPLALSSPPGLETPRFELFALSHCR